MKLDEKRPKSVSNLSGENPDLVHSEKLKALGMMSAGLAHEINNPLNYAMLGLELLKEDGRTMLAPEYQSLVSDIEDGLVRIRNIVRDLKIFSRRESAGNFLEESFLVGDVVNSAIRITAKLHEDIQVVSTLDTPYRVHGDVSSIAQVLVNLLSNSSDAIREKQHEKGKIDVFGRRVGSRYKLEIIDNGGGISREEIEDVFVPFYSTKNTGTGLGMTISKAIVERHGGKMKIESELGRWTSISFDLPLSS